MRDHSRLRAFFSPLLEEMGYRCVLVSLTGGRRPRLQILLERLDDMPITIEDCTAATRRVLNTIEEQDPIGGDYLIEVSSPGLERPLVTEEDFSRFKGKMIRASLTHSYEGRKNFQGVFLGYDGKDILLEIQGENNETTKIALPFSNIQRSHLIENLPAKGKKASKPKPTLKQKD